MDYHIIFIGIMILVIAFVFVDLTGGKKASEMTLKVYGAVFLVATLGALISYLLTH